MRHFNIPVFIPELACPFRCVYCNQYNITGSCKAPSEEEIRQIIDLYLSTIEKDSSYVEVAFFGGSFTGLTLPEQTHFLSLVQPFLNSGQVQGIRISTRPDYISEEILLNLKRSGVVAIELGAQSMDQEVLKLSGRGHSPDDVWNASALINDFGFELGLQMMTGLPGDTPEKSMNTARKFIESGAASTRIYPTLVIRDTPLEKLFNSEKYTPQSLDQAVELSARLFEIFNDAGIKVLRMGLHPSEGFEDGTTLIAGPYHPAFGELVKSESWYQRLVSSDKLQPGNKITVKVSSAEINAAIGHKGVNKKKLLQKYRKVSFVEDPTLTKGDYYVDID